MFSHDLRAYRRSHNKCWQVAGRVHAAQLFLVDGKERCSASNRCLVYRNPDFPALKKRFPIPIRPVPLLFVAFLDTLILKLGGGR